MEWNVYYHDISTREIRTMNVFRHSRFLEDVQKHLKKFNEKDEFEKALKSSLMYYFWSKSEYEIIISAWCGGNGDESVKIDIYSQIMLNWGKFVDYT